MHHLVTYRYILWLVSSFGLTAFVYSASRNDMGMPNLWMENALSASSSVVSGATPVLGASNVVLGKRSLEPQYAGCSSAQFLNSLSRATLRPDGPSRRPLNYSIPEDDTWTSDGFAVSFDMPSCPTPHIYSTAEACDLVRSFGGIRIRGDSLMRHMMNALMIILTGKQSGAQRWDKERCRGEHVFDDRGDTCRNAIEFNSEEAEEKPCGGDVWLSFEQHYDNDSIYERAAFEGWIESLPPHKRAYSPVFLIGGGLHYRLNAAWSVFNMIKTFYWRFFHAYPRPIGLWSSIHAPGENKPEEWLSLQGPEATKKYNKVIGDAIGAISPQPIVEQGGGLKMLDWYRMTDGAVSYDGSHYSAQVNFEKAMVLLNLLDLVWTETRDANSVYSLEHEEP